MRASNVDFRVYIEGRRVPSLSFSRSQRLGNPVDFDVVLPPTPVGLSVLPGTLVHVFVQHEGDFYWRLAAEGRVVRRRGGLSENGQAQLVLPCRSLDADWEQANVGMQMGEETGWPRPRLMHYLSGMAIADSAGVFPRHQQLQNFQMYRVLTGGKSSSIDGYFSFRTALLEAVAGEGQGQGPVAGLFALAAGLHNCAPLVRQRYNAVSFFKRMAYVENNRMTALIKRSHHLDRYRQRIQALPDHATLSQVMDEMLPKSFHHRLTIPSPYFNSSLESGEVRVQEPVNEGVETGDDGAPSTERALVTKRASYGTDNYVGERLTELYRLSDFASQSSKVKKELWEDVPAELHANARELARALTRISEFTGTRLSFSNAYRSSVHNSAVGGVANSQHLLCRAADIVVPSGYSPRSLVALIEQLIRAGQIPEGGIGLYNGFVHYDVRGHRARWNRSNNKRWPGGDEVARELADAGGSEDAGVMPSFVVKPRLYHAPPPMCNVFIGDRIGSFSFEEDFGAAPTRIMVMSEYESAVMQGPGTSMQGLVRGLHFAPRHLRKAIETMRDGHLGDIRLPDEPSSNAEEEANQIGQQIGGDMALARRTVESAGQRENAKNPYLSRLYQDGESLISPAHGRLLSVASYEELFKGIRPMTARFEFYEPSIDEEGTVDAFAHYNLSALQRQGRMLSLSLSLDTDVAVGFPGAFYHAAFGWIVGTVTSAQDTVSAAGQASTHVMLSGCLPLSDYENPHWARIHKEQAEEFAEVGEDGTPKASPLFDTNLDTDKVGDTVYRGLLGVGSVIDFSGAPTLVEALDAVRVAYEDAPDRRAFETENFKRYIATEEDVFIRVLGAEVVDSGYAGFHHISEVPEAGSGRPFTTERRAWVDAYANDLIHRGMAIDADGSNALDDPFGPERSRIAEANTAL